ncbi:unnamed protein product [Candidula unifasciata]|uniref:Phosphatidic acid phosphatase type 2/haloperoxidase domain-containing protein n=1 Tax=Candidula unifasciata TaxID=100452 RepID=A0A8S3Z767_9EUPU|nr:unnamed protein product [Candidula unifasciata]
MSALYFSKQFIVDVFIFILVFIPLALLHALGKPAANGFWCHDKSLGYPYRPDTVSMPMLMVLTFGAPFLVMAVIETIRAAYRARLFRQFRAEIQSLGKAYGVFLFGMAASCIFTESLKYSVGRLRPNFLDICRPDFDKLNCTTDTSSDRFITEYKCTNTQMDERIIQDSQLSFPSGHASMSMFSALFTVFYLQMRLEVKFSLFLRPTLQMALILMAVFCCVTRVTDYKHFISDVIAGCVIGICLAWTMFYKIAYDVIPSQSSQKSPGLPRATSIESEPQTPTPLLRPERLIISHSYRNNSGPDGLLHK